MSGDPTTKNKSTIYIGGLADDVDETVLIEVFSTFGDIIDVQIPTGTGPGQGPYNPPNGAFPNTRPPLNAIGNNQNNSRHRGFAFITYASPIDASDAIDNMDLNELKGKVLKVNLARPAKGVGAMVASAGNRAIWESEEWLQQYGKKPAQQAYGAPKEDGVDGGDGDGEGAAEVTGDGDDDQMQE